MGNTKMKKVWERRVVEIDDVRSRKTRLRLHFNGGHGAGGTPLNGTSPIDAGPRHGRKSVIGRTIGMTPIVLEFVRVVGRRGVDKPEISIVGIPGNPADSFCQIGRGEKDGDI